MPYAYGPEWYEKNLRQEDPMTQSPHPLSPTCTGVGGETDETNVTDAFEEALMRLVDKSPSQALCIVTGAFVSLTLLMLEMNGHKPEGDIQIDGGDNRDITIHAPKSALTKNSEATP